MDKDRRRFFEMGMASEGLLNKCDLISKFAVGSLIMLSTAAIKII